MKWCLGVAALAVPLACGAANATTYSAIYAFGDSLSDVGNVFAATGGAVPAPLFPSGASAYFDGRFSNGPNWVDDLSARLGLGPVLPSALGGDDFAVGGAETGTTSAHSAVPLVDLKYQVDEFKVVHTSPASDALYTLDIGANDIGDAISAYVSNPTFDLAAFVAQAAANTVGAVDELYAHGARNLLYYEVPDLSLVPDFAAAGPLGGELAAGFNATVLAGIKPLESAGLKVFDVPVFDTLEAIVSDPGRFGLANVTSPCISGNYVSPGAECADPDKYLFWDGEHPTAAGHALTADLAYRVLTVPEASTWAMMLIGFGGLGLAGWRGTRARSGATATA